MIRQAQAHDTAAMIRKVISGLLLVMVLSTGLPAATPTANAYMEPGLAQSNAGNVSVIVTGVDSGQVARAVERLGGTVTADLWLIDAVAADVPPRQLTRLSKQPGVHAVLANRGVTTAEEGFDGWVNTRRIHRGTIPLANKIQISPVALPDGGIAVLETSGKVQIFNADGSERGQLALPDASYKTAPVVDSNGNLYLFGDSSKIVSISPQGALRWTFKNNKPITGLALAEGSALLYAGDNKGQIHAINLATGQQSWQSGVDKGNPGSVHMAPVVANGTVYAVTKKGLLAAFRSDGIRRWLVALDGAPEEFPLQAGSDGSVTIVAGKQSVVAFKADGSPKFRYKAADKITAQPVLAADNTLFITTKDSIAGLNPDGSHRFQVTFDDKITTVPVLTSDKTLLTVALKNHKLIALDTSSGTPAWQYETATDLNVSPVAESDGSLHVLDRQGNYTVLNSFGVAIFSRQLESGGEVQPLIGMNPRRNVYVNTGDKQLTVFARLPHHWDNTPDVQPTDDASAWKLANPVVLDVGADMVHTAQLPNLQPITGKGVTVAILDSGVQLDANGQQAPGNNLTDQFLGQADFVDEVCSTSDQGLVGVQEDGYCFLKADQSQDKYGHGSHVAGIVWSNVKDEATGVAMGVAPDATVLSVRVLDENGTGTYADAIEGVQYIVANRHTFNIRVVNLSISAYAVTPYFVDPLNRAVEQAWAHGIVVVAAAGNEGPEAESITVPGNDPYVITVGAVDSVRTPGYWLGDVLPRWSATGPTGDGFVKPDVLAPGAHIVSLMPPSAKLATGHPDNFTAPNLFRMSGTSMAAAVASGVVALMLEANPALTPDQVKFRLAYAARPATTVEGYPLYNILQQGMGRIWAPTAIFGDFPQDDRANLEMDLAADLANGWATEGDLAHHYQGPVRRLLSDDGSTYLYYYDDSGTIWGLGAVDQTDLAWLDWQTLAEGRATWAGGQHATMHGIYWAGGLSQAAGRATWAGGRATWAGGRATWAGGRATWAGGRATWAGGRATWAGGRATWAGGMTTWTTGRATWAGGMATWAGGRATWAGGRATRAGSMTTWAGGINTEASILSSTSWVNDDGSTAVLQSHTVLNPAPEGWDVVPGPGSSSARIFLPAISR